MEYPVQSVILPMEEDCLREWKALKSFWRTSPFYLSVDASIQGIPC